MQIRSTSIGGEGGEGQMAPIGQGIDIEAIRVTRIVAQRPDRVQDTAVGREMDDKIVQVRIDPIKRRADRIANDEVCMSRGGDGWIETGVRIDGITIGCGIVVDEGAVGDSGSARRVDAQVLIFVAD
jgi:hypothetical protein